MKYILITLLLLSHLGAQEPAASLVESIKVKQTPQVPLIRQMSRMCAPTSFLTALQRETGLRLNDDPLLAGNISGMVLEDRGNGGNGGVPANRLFKILGMNYFPLEYNSERKTANLEAIVNLASTVLRNEVIPTIQKGSYFYLGVQSPSSVHGHAYLVTNYDKDKEVLTILNPSVAEPMYMTVKELAEKWPIRYPDNYEKVNPALGENRYYLTATRVEFAKNYNEILPPAKEIELSISPVALEVLKLPKVTTDTLAFAEGNSKLGEQTDWHWISQWWRKDRDPKTVIAVATIARIKVAQGEPVLMAFDKGLDQLAVGVVSGYRGGYSNPNGHIQVTFFENKGLVAKWYPVSEFLVRCAPRNRRGEYGCYIGYPKISLLKKTDSTEGMPTDAKK